MSIERETTISGHTKGPWGVEQTRDMLWVGPLREDRRKVDAVVVGLNIDSELTATAALRQHRNARLIAASPDFAGVAPDAADILEQYADYIRTVKADELDRHPYLPELERVAEALRAAIAKAKGQP